MKKIILLAAFTAASLMANAGDDPKNTKAHHEKYCTKMKDGMLKVMHEGKAITADVMLADGSTIKPDGMWVKKDGSSMMLKEGQCVDNSGKMHETTMEKMKESTKSKK
jgi:hypothetical protein